MLIQQQHAYILYDGWSKGPFPRSMQKIVNSWGLATQINIYVIYLAMAFKPQGINRGNSLLHFIEKHR